MWARVPKGKRKHFLSGSCWRFAFSDYAKRVVRLFYFGSRWNRVCHRKNWEYLWARWRVLLWNWVTCTIITISGYWGRSTWYCRVHESNTTSSTEWWYAFYLENQTVFHGRKVEPISYRYPDSKSQNCNFKSGQRFCRQAKRNLQTECAHRWRKNLGISAICTGTCWET